MRRQHTAARFVFARHACEIAKSVALPLPAFTADEATCRRLGHHGRPSHPFASLRMTCGSAAAPVALCLHPPVGLGLINTHGPASLKRKMAETGRRLPQTGRISPWAPCGSGADRRDCFGIADTKPPKTQRFRRLSDAYSGVFVSEQETDHRCLTSVTSLPALRTECDGVCSLSGINRRKVKRLVRFHAGTRWKPTNRTAIQVLKVP